MVFRWFRENDPVSLLWKQDPEIGETEDPVNGNNGIVTTIKRFLKKRP